MDRERQARWDYEHINTVSTKMLRGEYMQLRSMCLAQGTTPYALLRLLIRTWMVENAGKDRPRLSAAPTETGVALLFIIGA